MVPPLRLPRVSLVAVTALGVVFLSSGKTVADVGAEARSILSANCAKCHGSMKQKGGLRLDSRDGALGKGDSGSSTVVPGRPGASELIRRVSATDATVRMPPGETALTAAQVETLRKWIEA